MAMDPELVDKVAEAMTGWPLSSTEPEDAEAWRANARAALAVVVAELRALAPTPGWESSDVMDAAAWIEGTL